MLSTDSSFNSLVTPIFRHSSYPCIHTVIPVKQDKTQMILGIHPLDCLSLNFETIQGWESYLQKIYRQTKDVLKVS